MVSTKSKKDILPISYRALMLKKIKLLIKNVFSNAWSAIVAYIIGVTIAAYGGLRLLSKSLAASLLTLLNIPIPLWATIVFVLAVSIYIYLRTRKTGSSPTPNYKIKYFTVDNLKWKAKVYDYGDFEVERISICKEHDLPLINDNIVYYCPESIKNNCKNKFDNSHYSFLFVNAKSYIDKEVRNNK